MWVYENVYMLMRVHIYAVAVCALWADLYVCIHMNIYIHILICVYTYKYSHALQIDLYVYI